LFSAIHTLLIHIPCYCVWCLLSLQLTCYYVWYLSKIWYQSSLQLLYMVQSANMFHCANSPKTTKNSISFLSNLFGWHWKFMIQSQNTNTSFFLVCIDSLVYFINLLHQTTTYINKEGI